MQDDILLIDKPAGWTSFDVVAKIRGQIKHSYSQKGIKPTKRQLRVGHAGTLDPFATGLLIILLGDECKNAGNYLKLDKVYEATIRLGQVSTTGDPEGEITDMEYGIWNMEDGESQVVPSATPIANSQIPRAKPLSHPSRKKVEDALRHFHGEITQVPPAHSAIKINGQRAYKLAREGKTVEMPSRQVTIHSIDLVDYSYPELKIRAHVGSGTYIRTLAEDIGKALGVGAYCSALRRTKIGDRSIEKAISISEVKF